MNITRQDRKALDELLGYFDDCKDLTEDHVNAMLVILAEHRQRASNHASPHELFKLEPGGIVGSVLRCELTGPTLDALRAIQRGDKCVEVVNARTLEDLQRKLNHQRLMVQLAHKTFHELTQRSHKPEDDYNPSELLKVVAAERDERIAALEKQLAAANDKLRAVEQERDGLREIGNKALEFINGTKDEVTWEQVMLAVTMLRQLRQ